jgi:effector-binding domain-containing protein
MNTLYISLVVIGIFVAWSLWGCFTSNVENTEYSVIEKRKAYEIRLYPSHIVAQTTVDGPYGEALRKGFQIIAGYIFGGNTKKQSIAMTAPVVEKSNVSENIAMTAPVVATVEGVSNVVAFGMPRSYTLDTLPTPNDSRVKLVTIPEKKMAVMTFSWYQTDARVMSKKQELLDVLKKEGVTMVGSPQYAGYNAPWTPPWMTRNEVMVEIK